MLDKSFGILLKPFLKNRKGRNPKTIVKIADMTISLYCFFSKYKNPKRTGYTFNVDAKARAIAASTLSLEISELKNVKKIYTIAAVIIIVFPLSIVKINIFVKKNGMQNNSFIFIFLQNCFKEKSNKAKEKIVKMKTEIIAVFEPQQSVNDIFL